MGHIYKIRLRKNKEYIDYKLAELVEINPMKLTDVTETIALLDTGYSLEEFRNIVERMYGKDEKGNPRDINQIPFGWMILKTVDSAI